MDLRKIILLLIASFIASFLIRTVGTLFPVIFQNIYVVKSSVIVHTLFMLVQLLFYVYFYKEYAANRQSTLKTGNILAIIGSILVAFLYIKNVCLVFELDIIPLFLMNHYVDMGLPLAGSLLYLLFFGMFKRVQSQREHEVLDRPLSLAMIGTAIFMALHLVVLIRFLTLHYFNWLEHMPRTIAVGTIPFIVFAAISILYFYVIFYKFQSTAGNSSEF